MRPTPAAQPNNAANKRRHDDPRSLGAGAAVADAVGRRGDTVEESTETFIPLFVVRVRNRLEQIEAIGLHVLTKEETAKRPSA
jgi:hypothetical protein